MAGSGVAGWAASSWANYAGMGKCIGARSGLPHCVIVVVYKGETALGCAHCKTLTTMPWVSLDGDDRRAEQSQETHRDRCGQVHDRRQQTDERIKALADKRRAARTFSIKTFHTDPLYANDPKNW